MDIIIIGAGQTGRGLIAPIIQKNKFPIIFADKDEELVNTLNKEKKYSLKDFNSNNKIEIDNVTAFHFDISNEETIKQIANADIVTTSVYANNLEKLIPVLRKAISLRKKEDKLVILCIENGVNVTKVLDDANLKAEISSGVVFTTTVEKENLELIGEFNFEVPINKNKLSKDFNIKGLPLIDNFEDLIQRKIYTYNFLSAAYSYLGYYEDYKYIGDAANNKSISKFVDNILCDLNITIAKEFNISIDEQEDFSAKAVTKFKNKKIIDPIERNSRDVQRKLGLNERLLVPLTLARKNNKNIKPYFLIIATAIYYGLREESLPPLQQILAFLGKTLNKDDINVINQYLNMLLDERALNSILNIVYK